MRRDFKEKSYSLQARGGEANKSSSPPAPPLAGVIGERSCMCTTVQLNFFAKTLPSFYAVFFDYFVGKCNYLNSLGKSTGFVMTEVPSIIIIFINGELISKMKKSSMLFLLVVLPSISHCLRRRRSRSVGWLSGWYMDLWPRGLIILSPSGNGKIERGRCWTQEGVRGGRGRRREQRDGGVVDQGRQGPRRLGEDRPTRPPHGQT